MKILKSSDITSRSRRLTQFAGSQFETSTLANLQPDEVHKRFSEYGKTAKEWMRKCVLLLPQIEKHEIWRKKGFSSIYEYAGKLAGMSHAQVYDALRVMRRIEDKPALKKVVEEKGVGAVRPIVTIATAETQGFWAEKAEKMSVRTLETYAREYKKSCHVTKSESEIESVKTAEITMDLELEVAEELEKLKGKEDWNTLMKQLLELRRQELEKIKPEPTHSQSRHIPAKIKRYVSKKTNGQCAYPGCTKEYVILHHTQRWSLEKSHDPDRLVPLCKAHERLAHLGLIENEERSPEFWSVRLQPDQKHPKFQIDTKVQKFRCPG